MDTLNFFQTLSKLKQEIQGLQAFAFPVETVNNKYAKSRFKRKLRGQI